MILEVIFIPNDEEVLNFHTFLYPYTREHDL